MLVRLFLFLTILLSFSDTGAQMYIGITIDMGNQVTIYPNPDDLIKSSVNISGSVVFHKKEEIRNDWYLQYGTTVGSLGFRIKAREIDTLQNDPNFYDPYSSYSTLFVSGHFTIGKRFVINSKNVSLYLGGGATKYFDFFDIQTESGSSVWDGDSFEQVFEYKMLLINEKLKGFAEISIQTQLSHRILLGLQYRYHFNPSVKGTYDFYHTTEPLSGTLSITQRALSILFLVGLGKKL